MWLCSGKGPLGRQHDILRAKEGFCIVCCTISPCIMCYVHHVSPYVPASSAALKQPCCRPAWDPRSSHLSMRSTMSSELDFERH